MPSLLLELSLLRLRLVRAWAKQLTKQLQQKVRDPSDHVVTYAFWLTGLDCSGRQLRGCGCCWRCWRCWCCWCSCASSCSCGGYACVYGGFQWRRHYHCNCIMIMISISRGIRFSSTRDIGTQAEYAKTAANSALSAARVGVSSAAHQAMGGVLPKSLGVSFKVFSIMKTFCLGKGDMVFLGNLMLDDCSWGSKSWSPCWP